MAAAEIEAKQVALIRAYLSTYVPPVLIVAPPVLAEVVPIKKKRMWGHRSDVVQRPILIGRHNRFRKGKRKKKKVAA
jgi:hypothetical protein